MIGKIGDVGNIPCGIHFLRRFLSHKLGNNR